MTPRFRTFTTRAAAAAALLLFVSTAALPGRAAGAEARKANYELASRWTAAKVGKLVFDASVQPHWLETGERFWYSYETSRGRKWFIVDPLAGTKKPLFDNAKMAAQLTRILLVPYDAQHLPIRAIKFIKKDAAIQFEIEVPKDNDIMVGGKIVKASEIAKEEEEEKKTVEDQDKEKEKERLQDTEKNRQREAEKPKEPEKKTKLLAFTYDLATGKLALIEDWKEPLKRPRWASVSPDEKTVVFARGHNLFMMDAESFKLAQKKADDKAVKEEQLTTDGEEHYKIGRAHV